MTANRPPGSPLRRRRIAVPHHDAFTNGRPGDWSSPTATAIPTPFAAAQLFASDTKIRVAQSGEPATLVARACQRRNRRRIERQPKAGDYEQDFWQAA